MLSGSYSMMLAMQSSGVCRVFSPSTPLKSSRKSGAKIMIAQSTRNSAVTNPNSRQQVMLGQDALLPAGFSSLLGVAMSAAAAVAAASAEALAVSMAFFLTELVLLLLLMQKHM